MKSSEIDYSKNLGSQCSKGAFDKPFSLCLAGYGVNLLNGARLNCALSKSTGASPCCARR
jgi:hypothetical protein